VVAERAAAADAGVMERVPYREPGDRQRHEYRLTERGLDLQPALIALLQWGDKRFADPDGPSVVVRHGAGDDDPACEQPVRVVIQCDAGHGPLDARSLQRTPGCGARLARPA
jgi:hypothetical protein